MTDLSAALRCSDEDELVCPRCNGTYTHVDTVEISTASKKGVTVTVDGEDAKATATVVPNNLPSVVTTEFGSHAGRRTTITLIVECEWCPGWLFAIAFAQHKGNTFVAVSDIDVRSSASQSTETEEFPVTYE